MKRKRNSSSRRRRQMRWGWVQSHAWLPNRKCCESDTVRGNKVMVVRVSVAVGPKSTLTMICSIMEKAKASASTPDTSPNQVSGPSQRVISHCGRGTFLSFSLPQCSPSPPNHFNSADDWIL
ncbi:hypothetical protein V6N13_017601 [Hibiscus sabdariffa]